MRTLLAALAATCTLALTGVAATAATPATAAGDPPGGDAAGRAVPLRVMTYNILHGAGEDGVFDLDRTAAAIRDQHPDVVGLQEVDDHWGARSDNLDEPAELAAKLGMQAFFGAIYDLPPLTAGAPNRRYGVAILSRYPVVRAVDHEITRLSTQDPNPVPAPAPGFPEVVVDVQGALVHVFDTHLDYRGDPTVRRMQAADTAAIMAAAGGQQVLVGDFNATWDAPELAALRDYGLVDAWSATGQPGGETYPANAPRVRIDHVTVTPGIRVGDVAVPVTLASDHRPVVADLVVTRGDNR
jgi:endonuclease/exonuclease/phosphatase family metal-dependent hydrolase